MERERGGRRKVRGGQRREGIGGDEANMWVPQVVVRIEEK
jgi:hypothetical protein